MAYRFNLNGDFRNTITKSKKDYNSIAKCCDIMMIQCDKLKNFAHIIKDDKIIERCEESYDHFDFCKDFATGNISKEEWDDYEFDGDMVGLFNSYMNEFFDICDISLNKDIKFCWVNLN